MTGLSGFVIGAVSILELPRVEILKCDEYPISIKGRGH